MGLDDLFGAIEVVKIPDGEAPEKIRECWVGVSFPALYFDEVGDRSVGVLSGKSVPITAKVYVVQQENAIVALEKKEPEAGRWWREHGFPREAGALFSFRADQVIEIKSVSTRDHFFELMRRMNDLTNY